MNSSAFGGLKEQLVVTVDNEPRRRTKRGISEGFNDDLRTNAEWVAHGNADERLVHTRRITRSA
jgi:hypothetical protein